MNVPRIAIGVCACVALAACGSATDAITFKAPPGYVNKASLGPFMQIWVAPRENSIMLMAFPTAVDLDKTMTGDTVKDAKILKQSDIQICGSQRAVFVSMLGQAVELGTPPPGHSARRQLIDFIATDANGKTYMAMYVRPAGTASDPSAEAAIRNVCPK